MNANRATIGIEHDRTSSTRERHSDEEAFHDPITGRNERNLNCEVVSKGVLCRTLVRTFEKGCLACPVLKSPVTTSGILKSWRRTGVVEAELEQYKVRLKGYEPALTSVRFEVRNKQPISLSQFAHDYAPIYWRAPAAESRSELTRTLRELMGIIVPTVLESHEQP